MEIILSFIIIFSSIRFSSLYLINWIFFKWITCHFYYVLPMMSSIWCHTYRWLVITCWRSRGPSINFEWSFELTGENWICYVAVVFSSSFPLLLFTSPGYLVFTFRPMVTSVTLVSTILGVLNVFVPDLV